MEQRLLAYETVKQFARRYKIRLTKSVDGKRTSKTQRQLSTEIFNYEKRNDIQGGLYDGYF
jgi:hypothetical protein